MPPPSRTLHQKLKGKSFVTTGLMAGWVGCSPRTITKLCDNGTIACRRLKTDRTVRSPAGDRRIPIPEAIRYLTSMDLPVPPELRTGAFAQTVLVVGYDTDLPAYGLDSLHGIEGWVVERVSPISLVARIGSGYPVALILNAMLEKSLYRQIVQYRGTFRPKMKIVIISNEDASNPDPYLGNGTDLVIDHGQGDLLIGALQNWARHGQGQGGDTTEQKKQ